MCLFRLSKDNILSFPSSFPSCSAKLLFLNENHKHKWDNQLVDIWILLEGKRVKLELKAGHRGNAVSWASVPSSWHTAHDMVQACSQLHWGHAATSWPVGCGPSYCKSVLLKLWSMQQCPFANCMLPVCSEWIQKFKSKQLGTLTAIWHCHCIQAAFPFSSHSFLWKYWSMMG